jgi:hypothetical protein
MYSYIDLQCLFTDIIEGIRFCIASGWWTFLFLNLILLKKQIIVIA